MKKIRTLACLSALMLTLALHAQTPTDSISSTDSIDRQSLINPDSLWLVQQQEARQQALRIDSAMRQRLIDLAMQGHEQRMAEVARLYFDSGMCSDVLLNYNYNELVGMDEHAIFVGNGESVLFPKWVLQEAMSIHRNKTVVSLPFLNQSEYRQWLFAKLQLPLPDLPEPATAADSLANQQQLLQAIIDRYGSKVYFSSTTPPSIIAPWRSKLYNEGLLLKYSEQAYDNLSVKLRNVEERYLMDYLRISFQPDWMAGQRMSANYAVVLSDVLSYYSQHNQERYDWLMQLLVNGVMNTSLSEERKHAILKLLMH